MCTEDKRRGAHEGEQGWNAHPFTTIYAHTHQLGNTFLRHSFQAASNAELS